MFLYWCYVTFMGFGGTTTLFCYFAMLGAEPRFLLMLHRQSTIKLYILRSYAAFIAKGFTQWNKKSRKHPSPKNTFLKTFTLKNKIYIMLLEGHCLISPTPVVCSPPLSVSAMAVFPFSLTPLCLHKVLMSNLKFMNSYSTVFWCL